MYTGCVQGIHYNYFHDTKIREELNLYFALKNRNDHALDGIVTKALVRALASDIGKFDYVYYPESSSSFIKEIAELCGTAIMIPKNSVDFIRDELDKMFLMPDERESMMGAIDKMETFQMHQIKANQRWRFRHTLFQEVPQHDGRVALIDDSVFSGFTLSAAYEKVPDYVEKIAIFSK